MEHRLLILLFSTGFFPLVLSNIRKYHLMQEVKSWMDALVYCRANYTDLATINTAAEILQLQTLAQNQQLSSFAWIGLTWDWRWSLINDPLGSFRPWSSGEPRPLDTTPECAIISNSVWVDYSCSNTYPFICNDGKASVFNQYILNNISKTWYEAQSYCRQYHTDLASVPNITVNTAQTKTGGAWIGLIRDVKMWSDQPGFDFRWGIDQPANDQSGNRGVFFNGQISAIRCAKNYPFFCYSEITGQQQILRFKVKSDQNLNNPAVEEALLEKIQQKLNELSMANITVNFRMSTNGQELYKLENNPPVP